MLLSIIIPTRNRNYYCKDVIETILSFSYENFELVIQDNSDSLELKDYVDLREKDERLNYNYTPNPISSIDNFNLAIGSSKGEYLCLIGDDDSVHPSIFPVVEWAKESEVSSVVPTLKSIFTWPDACINIQDNGVLTIEEITGLIKKRSTNGVIKQLMQNGGQDYLNLYFPKLYHGIVKREFIEKIKKETGNYVGGLSPDIYIAIGLAKNISSFIEIDYPITLPGICGKSAPVDEKKNKYNKLEEAPHFRNRRFYKWSSQVPRFYSSPNIWADSALTAVKELNINDLALYFNKFRLGVVLLKSNPENRDEIINFLKKGVSVHDYYIFFSFSLVRKFINDFGIKLKFKIASILFIKKKRQTFKNVENIHSAIKILSENISEEKLLTELTKSFN